MVEREYQVRFLCTGNSARSIMAECAIGRWGRGSSEDTAPGVIPRARLIR